MKFKAGDKVIAPYEIEHVISAGTKGVVTAAYSGTHSSFPYDVFFENQPAVFPMAEDEIELYVPWYRRLWNKLVENTKPRDAEKHFGTEKTEQAFLEIQELPSRSVATVPFKIQ